MNRKEKGRAKTPGLNPFGQYRAAAKLKRVGDEVLLGEPSNNTVGAIQHDYPLLFGDVRQLDQYVSIKTRKGQKPTADELMTVFSKCPFLVGDRNSPGYATPDDLKRFVEERPTLFAFTRDLMAKAWGLARSTIDTLLKPNRNKQKKS